MAVRMDAHFPVALPQAIQPPWADRPNPDCQPSAAFVGGRRHSGN
jgi:hypothetical protein